MGPKKLNPGASLRKKKPIPLEIKVEIVQKHDNGARVKDLCKMYDRSASTICTILKQKEALKGLTPAKGVSILSKRRSPVINEMERLLLIWIREKHLAGGAITKAIICEKARAIYSDLAQDAPSTSSNTPAAEQFKASYGWFDKFRKRTGIYSVIRHGDGVSSDAKAAAAFVTTFAKLVNCDFERFESEDEVAEEIVSLGSSVDIDVTGADLNELAEEHTEEINMEKITHMERLDEMATPSTNIKLQEEEEKSITTKALKEFLDHWQHVANFVETKHPQTASVGRAVSLFNDTCVSYFRNIFQSRNKQMTMNAYFRESPSQEEGDEGVRVGEKRKDSDEEDVTPLKIKIMDDSDQTVDDDDDDDEIVMLMI